MCELIVMTLSLIVISTDNRHQQLKNYEAGLGLSRNCNIINENIEYPDIKMVMQRKH